MSAPGFLVDECLPVEVTAELRRRGLDAVDIVESGRRGADDLAVWALAAAEGRILLTRDLYFPLRDMLPRPRGLVLFRAPDTTAVKLAALTSALCEAIAPAGLADRITVVSPGRYRQRVW